MVKSYSTKGPPPLNQLSNVVTESVSNNDTLVYEDGVWKNKSDFVTDEIDCRVLRVTETADVGGRLAVVGVTSLVNDEFIFQNGISNLGDTLYIDNVNNRVGINKAVPDEDLDIAGTLRIEEDSTQTIRFYDTQGGGSPDENGRIEVARDGGGGEIKLYTLETGGGTPQERLTVNRRGALSLSTDYGSSGSILTSQGSGSPPTWNEPYYFGADITANQSVPSNSQVKIDFVPYLPSPYNGNNGDMTSGTWTCPTDGLYKVSLRVIISTAGDDIRSADIYIISNDGSDTYESGAKYFNNANDDIQVGTLACESLIPLSANDTIRGEARIVISSGGGRQFEKSATAGGKGTELVITRII